MLICNQEFHFHTLLRGFWDNRKVQAVTLVDTLKEYGTVKVQLHQFLTSALDVGEQPALRHGHFAPGQSAYSWIGRWMSPRAGLDTLEKRKISCPWCELNHDSSDIQPAA
jgi:hypothetical protein